MTGLFIFLGVAAALGLVGFFMIRRGRRSPTPAPKPEPEPDLNPGPKPDPTPEIPQPDPTPEPEPQPEPEPPTKPRPPKPTNSVRLLFQTIQDAATMAIRPETLIEEYERQIREIQSDWQWGDPVPQEFTFVPPAAMEDPAFRLPPIRMDWLHGAFFGALVVLGAAWYANAFGHWQPALQRNKATALRANRANIARMDSAITTLKLLDRKLDSANTGTINQAIRILTERNILATQDQLVTDSIPTEN